MFERNDRYLGIGIILIGIYCYITASGWRISAMSDPAGAAAVPKIMSAGFICIGVILIIGSFFLKKKDESEAFIDKDSLFTLAMMAAICFAYLLVLPHIGYLLATPLLIIGIMWLLGTRKIMPLLLVSLGTTLVLFVIFYFMLRINLPLGFTRDFIRGLDPRW